MRKPVNASVQGEEGMLRGVVLRAIVWRSELLARAMELMAVGMWVVTLCLWGPGEVDRMSS